MILPGKSIGAGGSITRVPPHFSDSFASHWLSVIIHPPNSGPSDRNGNGGFNAFSRPRVPGKSRKIDPNAKKGVPKKFEYSEVIDILDKAYQSRD